MSLCYILLLFNVQYNIDRCIKAFLDVISDVLRIMAYSLVFNMFIYIEY